MASFLRRLPTHQPLVEAGDREGGRGGGGKGGGRERDRARERDKERERERERERGREREGERERESLARGRRRPLFSVRSHPTSRGGSEAGSYLIEANRLVYHSSLGSRVMKKRRRRTNHRLSSEQKAEICMIKAERPSGDATPCRMTGVTLVPLYAPTNAPAHEVVNQRASSPACTGLCRGEGNNLKRFKDLCFQMAQV